jgi:hypothetical protein
MLSAPVFALSMHPTVPPFSVHICTDDVPLHSPFVEIRVLPAGQVTDGAEYQYEEPTGTNPAVALTKNTLPWP